MRRPVERPAVPDISATMVEWALWWAGQGWPVFPLVARSKDPYSGSNGFQDGSTDAETIRKAWERNPQSNIGASPPAGWVAVDGDPRKCGGEDPLVDWPATRTHQSGGLDRGRHLIYADPEGKVPQRQPLIPPGIDSRVSGKGYVVLPPSVHPDGGRYAILDDQDPVLFPYERLEVAHPKKTKTGSTSPAGKQKGLAALLGVLVADPDDPDLGDDWLSSVAGYLANMIKNESDYMALVKTIDLARSDPDPVAAGKKRSIWAAELSKQRGLTDEDRGWLLEAGDRGYSTQIEIGEGKIDFVPWSNFRIIAKGKIIQEGNITWVVDLVLPDRTLEDQRMPADVFNSSLSLKKWLNRRGAILYPSDRRDLHHMDAGQRMLAMIISQNAPELIETSYMGWQGSPPVFVTGEEEFNESGVPQSARTLSLATGAAENVKYMYGCGWDLAESSNVLREVLTWQEPWFASLFGAWWSMALLRGRYPEGSIFPLFAVEAPKGSGKSNGFLDAMVRLAGNATGRSDGTLASVAWALGSHNNGVLWLDDVKDLRSFQTTLRQSATGGSRTLRNQDNSGSHTIGYRSPVLLTAESVVGEVMGGAWQDRLVQVEMPIAKNRMSLRNPETSQWTDVLALYRKYGSAGSTGLLTGSGSILSLACTAVDPLAEMDYCREGSGNGRRGEVHTLLRVGARVLSSMTGDESHIKNVDEWVSTQPHYTHDYAVSVMIPWYLRNIKEFMKPAVMVMESGHIRVSATRLADSWSASKRDHNNPEERHELTTSTAVQRQLKDEGAELVRSAGCNWWELTGEVSEWIKQLLI